MVKEQKEKHEMNFEKIIKERRREMKQITITINVSIYEKIKEIQKRFGCSFSAAAESTMALGIQDPLLYKEEGES